MRRVTVSHRAHGEAGWALNPRRVCMDPTGIGASQAQKSTSRKQGRQQGEAGAEPSRVRFSSHPPGLPAEALGQEPHLVFQAPLQDSQWERGAL